MKRLSDLMARHLSYVMETPGARVLAVTNMWPDATKPVYGIFVRRQIEAVARLGISFDVLYVRGYESKSAYAEAAAWFATRANEVRARYSLLHIHAGETTLATLGLRRMPTVVSYCGDDLLGKPGPRGMISPFRRLQRQAVRHRSRGMTFAITKSREMQNALPATVRDHRSAVIPNGVDARLFRPRPKSDARGSLGWHTDEFVVLFAATHPHEPRKRLWLAKAACDIAQRDLGRPVRLHIAQDVDPAIMPALHNAADCLLITSSVEGSPNVVKEACMCNLPVVATRAGDIEDLLGQVDGSYVCPPNPDELGVSLAAVLRTRQPTNGRSALRHLTDEAVAERIVAVYASLVNPQALGPQTLRAS
jgi:glycosyltransferase involved in cell wall biosynthesis